MFLVKINVSAAIVYTKDRFATIWSVFLHTEQQSAEAYHIEYISSSVVVEVAAS